MPKTLSVRPGPLLYSIDVAKSGRGFDADLVTIGGWAFLRGKRIERIRAVGAFGTCTGIYGLDRPDTGNGKCGFHLEGRVPGNGPQRLVVQIAGADGIWADVTEVDVVVGVPTARVHLDRLPPTAYCGESTSLAGWCLHPTQAIQKLELVFDGSRHVCTSGLIREDVGNVFPAAPGSSRSGFQLLFRPTRSGHRKLRFEATLADGSVIPCDLAPRLNVRRKSTGRGPMRPIIKRAKFVVVSAGKVQRAIRIRGLAGTLSALPHLTQRAKVLYRRTLHEDQHAVPSLLLPQRIDPYDAWLAVNAISAELEADVRARLAAAGPLPLISVVMPVYNPPIDLLEAAVDSVRKQWLGNWELCIADDQSTRPEVRKHLEAAAAADVRIRVTYRPKNGNISAATNSAAAQATGEFILLLDQDDLLTPDALAEFALSAAEHPDWDIVYSDNDKIGMDGKRYAPEFKPDWSPELFLAYMYLTHAVAIRRSLFEAVGGMRLGLEGSQDHDLILRAAEHARGIGHIPLVLYHWRAAPGSTAQTGEAKPESFLAGTRAIQESLDRRKVQGKVHRPRWAVGAGAGIYAIAFPDAGPQVTILIPTRNQLAKLKVCIDSLKRTTYKNFDVIIIDNDSDDPETLEYLRRLPHRVLRVSNEGRPFSFARINNIAAREAKGDYLLFLNNDTQVIEPTWLSQMVGCAQIPGVGSVGARLLYADGRIQHAGIVHGLHHGLAGHAFKLLDRSDNGYLSWANVMRDCAAVTAACMLTDRQRFLAMGGFDEKTFAIAYNDVDFGYRLEDRGLRNVYCPGAELLHHEGVSRGFLDSPAETAAFKRRFGHRVDRYYNPNLSMNDEQFAIQPACLVRGPVRRIRTLVVSNALLPTGAPHIQYEISSSLHERGIIEAVVFADQDGPMRKLYERHGIEIIVDTNPIADARAAPELYDESIRDFAEQLKKWKIGLVYANTLETFYAVDAAAAAGIPSVWNIHESEGCEKYFADQVEEIKLRAMHAMHRPYRTIFGSDATREQYRPLETHHNFTVIHNVLDMQRVHADHMKGTRQESRRNLGLADDEIMFLLLGTICDRKGQMDMAHALEKIDPHAAPKAHYYFVGDRPSPCSAAIHQIVDNLDPALRGRVQIIKETPHVVPYYLAADVFLCTSRIECYPRVTLEAMTFDLPIISTPVFGLREQLREKFNAIFYNPGDIAALAAAMEKLRTDSALRAAMAAQSRHVLAVQDTMAEVVAKYARIFQEALRSTAPAIS